MPKFNYIAVDNTGKETRGQVEASDQQQAIAKIRGQGLFPTAIGAAGGGGASAPAAKAKPAVKSSAGVTGKKSGLQMEIKLPAFLQKGVKTKDLMVLTRQLATLVDAGLPLLRGLRVLLRQCSHPTLKHALTNITDSVESGTTFSESLHNHPKVFNNLYVNMVKAGEAGGILEVVLTRLAEFMEKAEKIKNKVKGAMIYPIILLIAAVGILAFLLIKIIPKFQEIFTELLEGQKLPGITLFVMGFSELVKNNIVYIAGGVTAVIVLFTLWGRTKNGRYAIDKIKLYLPMFGSLIRRTAVSRFSRTLGTLLSSGVPVLQALMIVRDTSGNAVIAKAIQDVHDSVKEGESMAGPMEVSKVFPPMVISMVEVGEETGALPDMLLRIANTYDDEVDNAVAGLTSIIEPVMIIFLAVVVGTIVIAMFLPLVSIITTMSNAAGG